MSRESRKGYEFSKKTIDSEVTNWHSKNPGNPDVELNVHHILNVQSAKKYGVPKEAVRSRDNAVAVEKEFHKKIHREQTEEGQKELANWFLSVWRKLF